jgi:hypothetical protein
MKTLKEKIAIMQAFENGEAVEVWDYSHIWTPLESPSWDWFHFDYRVAVPPPKREPKLPEGLGWWVKDVESNAMFLTLCIMPHETVFIAFCGSLTIGQLAEKGWLWTRDGKQWFNFYGEEVK